MRLIVLDTNVVVSAGIEPRGASAKIVLDWLLGDKIQIATCPWIASEYRDVAHRAKFHRYGFPPNWLEFLIATSLQLPDPAPWPHSLPDLKDAPFLALAHAAGAWLVTGNLRHFPAHSRRGVTVLPPAEYLAHLERGASGVTQE